MSSETKSPPSETQEPQQITPQTDELDAEKLDQVAGGNLVGSGGTRAPSPPPPVG
jgi:hypothetical protein